MGALLGGLLMPLGGSGVAPPPVVVSPIGPSPPVYFDGHFPPAATSYWGGHFPEGRIDTGLSPGGAGTFALLLENGVVVTYAWRTGLFKSYSGLERRSSIVDDPAQRYEGSALLVSNDTRATRSRLARYAALGRPFLLGLSYEQITIRASSTGATVPVYTTERSDWAVPGGRVIVRHKTHGDVERVILSVTATTLVLDSAPGNPGLLGGVVMPAMAVFLDPTQGFDRYPTQLERWQIRARNAIAGFASPPTFAQLSLAPTVTNSGTLDNALYQAREAGAAGNSIMVRQTHDALTESGELIEDPVARTIHIKYMGESTTVDQLATLVNAGSSLISLIGTWTGSAVLASADDAFTLRNLTGGADATTAEVGRGATVNEFAGRPIWDRGIDLDATAPDSMQSMAQAQDFGGLPFAAGSAAAPDWGRHLMISRPIGAELQWVKRFLSTIRGRWRTFWLATWRPDLVAVSSGVGTLTVQGGEDSGDFFAWWPAQQQYLQIKQADGTLTYCRISAAVQTGATIALTIVNAANAAVTLSASTITMVSWLEVCRLESDEVAVQFSQWNFTLSTTARVVRQASENVSQDELTENEASVELSRPREGIEFIVSGLIASTYRYATGTRDITINGQLFRATAIGRGDVMKPTLNADGALEIALPIAHPIAQRYMVGGVPPRQVMVRLWRKQLLSGGLEKTWDGEITSMAIEGHIAKFLAPSRLAETAKRRVPTVSVGRTCLHVLYDSNCRVNRNSFKVTAAITNVTGRVVRIGVAMDEEWATFGEILHVASGERMTIQKQTSTFDLAGSHAHITMQAEIYGIKIGDLVEVYAGCDHRRSTCRNKFNNIVNYGGFPDMPTKNPFSPNGIGLYQTK